MASTSQIGAWKPLARTRVVSRTTSTVYQITEPKRSAYTGIVAR